MPALDDLLLPGERVRLEARPHPVALVVALGGRALWLALILLATRVLASPRLAWFLEHPVLLDLAGGEPLPLARWASRAAWLGALVLADLAAGDGLAWRNARFVLTDQRVLNLSGAIDRMLVDTPLDRADDILVSESWLGRRLGYGDLGFVRGSDGAGSYLRRMTAPHLFRHAVQAARLGRMRGLLEEALRARDR